MIVRDCIWVQNNYRIIELSYHIIQIIENYQILLVKTKYFIKRMGTSIVCVLYQIKHHRYKS